MRKNLLCTLMLLLFSGMSIAADKNAVAPPPQATKPVIGTLAPAPGSWGRIEFVNVRGFPYDGTPDSVIPRPPLGPTSKTIFQSPEAGPNSALPVGQLIHLVYQPTFNTKMPPAGAVDLIKNRKGVSSLRRRHPSRTKAIHPSRAWN